MADIICGNCKHFHLGEVMCTLFNAPVLPFDEGCLPKAIRETDAYIHEQAAKIDLELDADKEQPA